VTEKTDNSIPFVLIRKHAVLRDAEPIGKENKLGALNNNGRKILATGVMPQFGEVPIENPIWKVPAVLGTGDGGLEIATFTEFAGQDRHKHGVSTEIYTVLKGTMLMYINDQGPYEVHEMEEVVIFPGTVHEVVQQKVRPREQGEDFDLVVRVHALNCHGVDDKYVQLEPSGEWLCWNSLSREQRQQAFKKQR